MVLLNSPTELTTKLEEMNEQSVEDQRRKKRIPRAELRPRDKVSRLGVVYHPAGGVGERRARRIRLGRGSHW